MNGLQRLQKSEETAILDLVRANGLDASKLACYMTRQTASGRGRHSERGGFSILSGQAFNISYNLMLCEYCGNLEPSAVCPAKAAELKRMSENELNDSGVFVENYGNGFMLADYREGDNARYCGSDLSWRRQPITYSPFVDKVSAVTAGAQIISS